MGNYSIGQIIRHMLMRLSMGFTLGWFGFLQVRDPESWVEFIPRLAYQVSPVSDTSLVFMHGGLLLLAAVGLTFGLYFLVASWLGLFLLADIIVALLLDGGPANLIVRDIAILGLAIGLAFDNVRFWQLGTFMPKFRLRKTIRGFSSSSA